MSENLIRDAFKSLDILNEDVFELDNKGLDELEKFLSGDHIADDVEYVIDPEAESTEELKDSYIDRVILDCDVCHAMLYKDQDDVIIDEETEMANVGEPCPYCQSTSGFKIIGMVAPYGEEACECEDEQEEDSVDDDFGPQTDDEIEETEEAEEEESLEENLKEDSKKPLREEDENKSRKKKMINLWDRVMGLLDGTDLEYVKNKNTGKRYAKFGSPLYDSNDIGIRDNSIFVWVKDEADAAGAKKIADKYGLETKLGKPEIGVKGDKNRKFFIFIDPDKMIEDDHELKLVNERLTLKKKFIKEDFQKISIENKDNITTVDTDEEGKTTVTTEPKKDEEVEASTEVIKPLSPEVKDKIESNNTEEEEVSDEVDVDIQEIDEDDFDMLGESYLKRVYDNVQSYKTLSGRLNENKIMLEGLLTFKSGKKVKTNFIFESHYQTKSGKLKFLGENVQISPKKGAFTLTGNVKDKKLLAEALTYRYNGKDAKTGKPTALYGTVKNPKRIKRD